MDDWATSSPWAETANDDNFDTFQSPAPPPPVASNGPKHAPGGGGVANGHPSFKAHKDEPFGNGWGFGDHDISHGTDAHVGWKLTEPPVTPNGDGTVDPIGLSRLKPAKHDWEYKNEWAKSEEDFSQPQVLSVWDKGDDWVKPESPRPETADQQHPKESAVAPVIHDEEPIAPPVPAIPIIDIKADQPEASIDTHTPEPPGQLTVDSSVTNLDTRRPSLKTTDLEAPSPRATSPRPASFVGDDFGDFEDEDDSADPIDFQDAPTFSPEREAFAKREIDIDNIVVGSLSVLDGLYNTRPFELPAGSDGSEIISTTSQRKTWYKLIRKESARNSIQGEDVLRVRWSGSEVQQRVHDIVKRWISEDRISGRTMVGRNSGGSFDWNSSPPSSSGQSGPQSPTRSSFPPPKATFNPPTRSSTAATSPVTPKSPSFGWNSVQSPRSPGIGWAGNKGAASAKPASNTGFTQGQTIGSPVGISAFSILSQNSPRPASRHMASNSVDLPRTKATQASARPTSLLVEPSSRSLFGELAAMRSPPAVQSSKAPPPPLASSMDFSIFESKPVAKEPQTPVNTSFDDDFGDFEGSDFQSPSTPQLPTHVSPKPGFQVASPQAQPKVVPPTFEPVAPFSASGKPIHPLHSEPSIRSSFDAVIEAPDVAQAAAPMSNLRAFSPPQAMSQSTTDPWGSFDIFDAPKPSQPVTGLATAGPASSPPTQRLPQRPPGPPNGKSPGFAEPKRPALPILFARPSIPSRSASKPAEKSDDFDDWGEMVTTPSSDQKAEWAPSQTPKLSVSSEPETQVRRRSWTLDMFGSPEDNITSANPVDLLDKPKPATSSKKVPSPISINKMNNMPTIPGTPSPGAMGLFSPGVLVPQRNSASNPSSVRGSLDASRQNPPTPRNASLTSLNSLSSMGAKPEETAASIKQITPPKLQTQPPKPAPSPQPSVSSPLSTEWNDADFGFFEEATPAPKEKVAEVKSAASTSTPSHRSTGSIGGVSAQRAGGKFGHSAKGSVTMAPIVGKKDEDATFKEIIDLLPDMGYMLK
ncbi:hypothetical protein TWF696_007153 [Orbilia brochopaga]|uniref:Uncharacterized protein n=1 Tax=Orbilia brochopaga TaxID=3140254 RepID=A0AAV9UV99_9PEZI